MDSVAGAIKFLALNGATAVAAVALASRCRFRSRAERLLAAIVCFVGVALATALLLGVVGELRFWPLLVAQVAAAAAAGMLAKWSDVAELKGVFDLRRWFPGPAEQVAAGAVAFAYLYVVFIGLVTGPFTGDELMYHLPIAVEYLRQGRIAVPQLGRYWYNDLWAYYPGNAYLLYQWWLQPFGTGVVVDLVQLPYAFAGALAAYVLARRLGAGERAAGWSALLLLAVPIVINQSKTAMVDVTVTFAFASGLALLLAPRVTMSRLILAAVAWGAAPGIKLAILPFLALGSLCVAVCVLARAGWRRGFVDLMRIGSLLAGGAVLFSGYWFARNYRLQGSPLFPANLVAGDPLTWSNILYYGPIWPFLDFTIYAPMYFYNYETGAGMQFVALLLPSCMALVFWAIRRRRYDLLAIALLPLVAYPFWVLRSSRSLQTLFRYVLPAMPVGFAAFGWMIERVRRQRVLTGLAALCVLFSTFNALPHVGSFLLPESVRTALVSLRRQTNQLGRFDRMGDLALQDYLRAWHYFDELPGRHDIAVRHLIFTYPMLGRDFRHHLHFLEVSTPEKWLADLRAAHVEQVALSGFRGPIAANLSSVQGNFQIHFEAKVAGDEYVGATRPLDGQKIEGVKIRYSVPSPQNAVATIGLNALSQVASLPLDAGGGEQEYTMRWSGQITSLQLLLGAVPRTDLRASLDLKVSSIELIDVAGGTVSLPLKMDDWSRLAFPIEYYWMESDTKHFHLAFTDEDAYDSPYSAQMRIYDFVDKD